MFTICGTTPLGFEFMLEKLRVQCDAAEESGTAKTVTAGAIALSSTVSLQIPLGDISEIPCFRQSII